MRPGRRRQYTEAGIGRLSCVVAGCRNKAHASWQACADDGLRRPICKDHDIELKVPGGVTYCTHQYIKARCGTNVI